LLFSRHTEKGKVSILAKHDVYWFKHDANARRDQKILEMRSVYGSEGYGWWWMLLELMREATDYKLKLTGKYAISTLAKELDADPDRLKQFIDDCINEFDLFQADDRYFWSPSLLRRMKSYDEVVNKRREAANSRWNR
jgi:hypothetical protein